ncbi:hypothetical protein PG5_62690 [Pseudomonas sp. G5(2012)]|nr:hypothetical protein PG5_62690 [Pseudomonas sp. G5(2012)]
MEVFVWPVLGVCRRSTSSQRTNTNAGPRPIGRGGAAVCAARVAPGASGAQRPSSQPARG